MGISTRWGLMAYLSRSERHCKKDRSPATARCRPAFKLSLGRTGSPGHEPPPRHLSPEWGSTGVKGELVKEKEKPEQKTVPIKDQLTLPTPTPKSDVRTIDKQSNLETTPVPVTNKHYRGWLIPITINQISTFGYWCHVYYDRTAVIRDFTSRSAIETQER